MEKRGILSKVWLWGGLFMMSMPGPFGFAAEHEGVADQVQLTSPDTVSAQLVEYPATFFARYQPNTALDMISQVPGFVLDDGTTSRGFSSAAGNILINDRRPSAKQDLPSIILARIPASLVERVELIRGQVREIDLQGQVAMVNIVLRADAPASIRWEVSWKQNIDVGPIQEGNISIAHRWREIDYNSGLFLRKYTRGEFTYTDTFDHDGVLEVRRNGRAYGDGYRGSGNLNASAWVGQTLFKFNSTLSGDTRDGGRRITIVPQASGSGPREEFIGENLNLFQVELGTDAERRLGRDVTGKGLLLFIHMNNNLVSTLGRSNSSGVQTLLRIADTDSVSTEAIVRTELSWTGLPNHTFQANLEGAYNSLEGSLIQTEDTGTGAVAINVPNANTHVEEARVDFLLKDTWSINKFELDYGLGAEVSQISQSGDSIQKRSFFFYKPQSVLTYTSGQGEQTKLRLAREVSQLNFDDFVSISVFEDDDLALGNPNLAPDTTWVAELSHERRFGQESVVNFTIFYNWITDVVDLLPLTDAFEAPGNIGDGTRWGARLQSTLPLGWLGLTGAKLGLNVRWQDSSVTDPVTGEKRILSSRTSAGAPLPLSFNNDNEYAFVVNFRQDFPVARMAWGWDMRNRAARPLYKVNELDNTDEGTEFNAFIETTRWLSVKMRVNAENIFNLNERRKRTAFTGQRNLSEVDFHEIRDRTIGFRVSFLVSGSF